MEAKMRVLSATAQIGYGFPVESLQKGLSFKPDIICADAGSTDAGPYYLGTGTSFASRKSCKRDLSILIPAALEAKIPLFIGSAGGAGGDANVNMFLELIQEISKEQNLKFSVGVVYCEQDKQMLKEQLHAGKIKSMGYFPELTDDVIDNADHSVGMMGTEVFMAAYEMGVDVVIAGRTSDTAIFASYPIAHGIDPGLAWHAAKLLECGACSTQEFNAGDTIMVTFYDDCFYVEPMNKNLHHTSTSVAAHSLYENGNPFHLYEPGGMINLEGCHFEAISDYKVKVTGSQFVPSDTTTIKLEAAQLVGYRTVSIMGTRDPVFISRLDEVISLVRKTIDRRVYDLYNGTVKPEDYILNYKYYGKNAIMGDLEPEKENPHELGIVIDVVAKTQEIANSICQMARTFTLHHDFPGRRCTAGNMAIAFSPSDAPWGPVYEFTMEHLLTVEDQLSVVRIVKKEFG